MKTLLNYSLVFIFVSSLICCGGGADDDSAEGISNTNFGTFGGSFQVTDDPQTNLGTIFNANVNVKRSGDNFAFDVNGDFGFNRAYVGKVDAQGNDSFIISLLEQTGPEKKVAGGTVTLKNNELGITILLANDAVMVKKQVNDTTTFEMPGKLRLSGSFLKN